jgi:hypothetical protein
VVLYLHRMGHVYHFHRHILIAFKLAFSVGLGRNVCMERFYDVMSMYLVITRTSECDS